MAQVAADAGPVGPRLVGIVVAVALGGIALVVAFQALFGGTIDPEAELITYLKQAEAEGLKLEIPGAADPLKSSAARYDRFTTSYEPGSETAYVAATLELTGKLGEVHVGSFTVERLAFQRRDGEWVPLRGLAPTLTGVVAALQARREALAPPSPVKLGRLLPPDRRDQAEARLSSDPDLRFLASLKEPRYEVKAWYLRAEAEEALVTEDYRLQGSLPDRPIDQKGSRRLTLRRHGDEFFFWPGLM